jgi:D-alanyl-D-alanine carboxypeptidase/D-alanyl-D-alanine-endopeptidase (penicillin-binding protein 4)
MLAALVAVTLAYGSAGTRAHGAQDRSAVRLRPQQSQQQITQPAPAIHSETLDSLVSRISAHISQPRFAAATWGIKVVSLDTGKTLFEHNAEKYFSPASNAKLYSCALALDRLGADYRIKTTLYSTARPDSSGTIRGDLIVYGRGDPTMAARLYEGDYFRGLEPLADKLVASGIKRIDGDLIGDESFFQGPPFGSGWEWDDLQWYYGAEVSALSTNDNSLDLFVKPAEKAGLPCIVTTGPSTPVITLMNRTRTVARGAEGRISVYRPVGENVVYVSGTLPLGDSGYTGYVAVHNPANLFISLFKEVLANRGISVRGRLKTVDWKYREVSPIDFGKLTEIGYVESLPIKDIIRETLKPSQNLWSQLLLLQVGATLPPPFGTEMKEVPATPTGGQVATNSVSTSPVRQTQPPNSNRTTEQLGVEALNLFLGEAGVKSGDVMLEEGSGLSRKDLITPNATVELLKYMSKHRWADFYRDALPIAGVDGTLERRMKSTPAERNLRAKTGTLRYVYTLSGYVTTVAGERLVFSMMLNNASATSGPSRDSIDPIAVMLASFSGRSQ